MESQLLDLVNDFSGYGIDVFYGRPIQFIGSDFEIDGLFCMMEFCEINDIKTVMFDCRYATRQYDSIEQIKDKLEEFYKTRVAGYLSGINRLPHIAAPFYEPVWVNIVDKLEQEYSDQSEINPQKDNEEEEITQLFVWAFHQGVRIFTEVELEKDVSTQQTKPEQPDLLKKYQQMLSSELLNRHMEAYKENQRLERIRQQTILDEIAKEIQMEGIVDSLTTVKARNDYADRICTVWQIERGHEWVTKKAVRSIVELEYAHRNSR